MSSVFSCNSHRLRSHGHGSGSPTPVLALLVVGLQACQPATEPDCGLTSSLPGFEPRCETAATIRYVGETRFFVEGTAGLLTAYLPEQLESQRYGGTSGNPLVLLLSLERGDETAKARTSWLTIGEVRPHEVEIHLNAEFEGGTISGSVQSPMFEE